MSARTYDATDVRGNELALACLHLVAGKHGPEQPRDVRLLIRVMESDGLAAYDERRGWSLTAAGKKSARLLARGGARRPEGSAQRVGCARLRSVV